MHTYIHTTTTGHGGDHHRPQGGRGDQKNQTILYTHTHSWVGGGGLTNAAPYIYTHIYIYTYYIYVFTTWWCIYLISDYMCLYVYSIINMIIKKQHSHGSFHTCGDVSTTNWTWTTQNEFAHRRVWRVKTPWWGQWQQKCANKNINRFLSTQHAVHH